MSDLTTAAESSLESRAADIFGEDAPAAPEAPTEGAADEQALAPAAAAEPDEAAKARAARRQALQQAQTRERERVDAATAARERDELRARLKAAEDRAAAAERRVDVDALDEDGLLGLLERSKRVSPQRIGERLRELIANPELQAVHAARTVVDPALADLKQQNELLRQEIESIKTQSQQEREAAADARAAQEFLDFTQTNAGQAPHSAFFLSEYGVDEYLKIAARAAEEVPAHVSDRHQAILDEVEDVLVRLAKLGTASQQRPVANTPPSNLAPAKAPTNVSNTLAQQRSSVVDETADFARLSVEERANKLFGT